MFNKKTISIFIIIFLLLMIFLALGDTDYYLSKALINKESVWANFFKIYGEVPAYLLLLISSTILFGIRDKASPLKNISAHMIGIPFIAIFSFSLACAPIYYINKEINSELSIPFNLIIIGLLISITLLIISLLAIKKCDYDKLQQLKHVAILSIILIISEMILINILKVIWGRPRMRSIESIDGFKKWYEITGPSPTEEFKSFPSGHTGNAFTIIVFNLYLSYLKNVNKKMILLFTLLWGTLVALSRIVIGAHFLSDVVVASYITIFIFLGLCKFSNRSTAF